MALCRVERSVSGRTLSIETGKIAKQATGSVVIQYGETVCLVAACEGNANEERDFLALQVEYREKAYAAGKFPGGFIKREGRPSTKETLTSRMIDRPIRSLFPPTYLNEIQVMAAVLAADRENDPDIVAMNGASAALYITEMPYYKPVASVRVGRVGGELVAMPTYEQLETSDLDLVVSGTRDGITMIEGFSREMPEDQMADAIMFGHKFVVEVAELIEDLRDQMGLKKKSKPDAAAENPLIPIFRDKFTHEFKSLKLTVGKLDRYAKVKEFKQRIKAEFLAEGSEYTSAQVGGAIEWLEERVFRDLILEGKRLDGRQFKELRAISCEVGVLPRVHGSALFTRGETQALVVTTLGTVGDEQRVDGLVEEVNKKFMLDYNFPPYSVGEVKRLSGPGRREIGHGMLAERSLKAVVPAPNKFPYTIRLVSEITESNGSSSMASVCGGTLALMDAGVPIKDPIAGISIGLVREPDKFILLTDIQGDEDHFGDMDFKVAGTQRGVTGIQLDLKIDAISEEIIRATLDQARDGRREILRSMLSALRQPRAHISKFAPRMLQVKINPEKIGLLIGPGGKMIKSIQEATGAKIDIAEDGTVSIAHSEAEGAEAAKARIEALTEEVKVGKIYEGKVTSIKEFGAFVEILPGRDGLCHISELANGYVGKVDDVCKVGDRMQVKVIGIDDQDRVKLSRKALMAPEEGGGSPPPQREPREGGPREGGPREGGGGDRGGRDGGNRDGGRRTGGGGGGNREGGGRR